MNKYRISLISLLLFCIISVSAQNFIHPWTGKRVAFFGDSITDPKVTTPGKDCDGKTNQHYWDYLKEWLNITPMVYAISGRQWNDIERQTNDLLKEHQQEVDAILIFMGTNDYIKDVPLGEWYIEVPDTVTFSLGKPAATVNRLHRTLSMDKSTLRGRINIAMKKLKQTYPNKQIVVLTPIHRAFATFNDKNIQPAEDFANELGLYIDDYVKAICECGDIWAVPVINLFSLSGIYPMLPEFYSYFKNPQTDRLHPNTLGQKRIAETLYYQLITLPCGPL